MSVRGYTLAVDWSGHGDFAGPGEDVTSRVQKTDIVVVMGRDPAAPAAESFTSGDLSAALNNHDRALSPENTGSALSGKIRPGRAVKFTASAGAATTTLFQGVLDDYDVGADVARTFTVKALDAWGRPGAEKLSTSLYTGIRTGDAVGVVLDEIGWTGDREIDAGASVLPIWWVEGDDAAGAINNLVRAEGPPAVAYVRGGTFVFRDRHHRMFRARSLTSQATFTRIEPSGPYTAGDLKIDRGEFAYDHGLREIANAVTFATDVRLLGVRSEVWASDDQLSLIAGETRVIEASDNDPFAGAQVDYELQSGVVDVGLSRTSGASVLITVTASTDAVITRLAVSARAAPIARTVKATATDASSVAEYTRTAWLGESPPYVNPYDAQAIADRIVAMYATNRPRITLRVSVLATNTPAMAKLLALDVSDRVTIRNDNHDVNGDYVIERVVHTVDKLIIHRTEITAVVVDPVQAVTALTFGAAGRGFNQGTFVATGVDNPGTVLRFDVAGQGFNQGVFGT